jgi:HlyD family secretion protein
MTHDARRGLHHACRGAAAGLAALLLAACGARSEGGFQGYIEGEFVNVAAPFAGRLERLAAKRGDDVKIGASLYALDAVSETAAEREAQAQLASAQARLDDLKLGRRPPEQAVTQAQVAQAQVDAERAATQLARDEVQFRVGGIAQAQLDDARAALAGARARVAQSQSELAVARLPGRGEQIRAQAALVDVARAALAQAGWRLDQKSVAATRAGQVTDTLYREGEWVPAGSPVVRVLPPENVKVRFFVPESVVAGLAPGRAVAIRCDGCGADIPATLAYVSAQAEFTPPVIYSNETRSKLVFMVEARPTVGDAKRLHPGLPVSVFMK